MMQNPNCSGTRCEHEHSDVRMYVRVESLRNITKLRLCEACWNYENARKGVKALDYSKAAVYADNAPHIDMPLSYTRSDDGAKMVIRAPFVYLNQRY